MTDWLTKAWARNDTRQLLIAAAVFVVTWIAVWLLRVTISSRVKKLADRTHTQFDDVISEVLQRNGFFLYLALALYLSSWFLRLPDGAHVLVHRVVGVSILLQAAIWLQAGIQASLNWWRDRNDSKASGATMAAGLGFLSRLAIWSSVLIFVMSMMGVRIDALVAGLGVGGVAAALAVQNILGDLFASLSMYFDRPFDLGDFIVIDDFLGNVEKIGLRSTRLRSLWGEQLIFANSDIIKSRIRNYKRMFERRLHFHVGVTYGTPLAKLREIPGAIRNIIETTGTTRFDRCHMKSFGDSALVFEVAYYVLSPDYAVYLDCQQAINFDIIKYFDEQGIDFAFPTQTVHLVTEGNQGASPHATLGAAA